MKIKVYSLVWLCLFITAGFTQQYLTGGVGLIVGLVNSDGLDRFVSSYNQVNAAVLINPVSKFSQTFGVRGELGYRYMGGMNAAVLMGYQGHSFEDMSEFSNNESRNFKLSFSNIFIEGELGYTIDNFLINGLLGFYLNRTVEMETWYNGVESRSLNGKYRGDTFFSCDIGISLGVNRAPFFLVGKIGYPLYTSGRDARLLDENAAKRQANLHLFPDDYRAYIGRQPYDGVPADIDGLKFLIVLSYAFRLDQ